MWSFSFVYTVQCDEEKRWKKKSYCITSHHYEYAVVADNRDGECDRKKKEKKTAHNDNEVTLAISWTV